MMRDGWWNGKLQKMKYSLGVPKGMRVILQERVRGRVVTDMRNILASHPDFQNENSRIEQFFGGGKGTPFDFSAFFPYFRLA